MTRRTHKWGGRPMVCVLDGSLIVSLVRYGTGRKPLPVELDSTMAKEFAKHYCYRLTPKELQPKT